MDLSRCMNKIVKALKFKLELTLAALKVIEKEEYMFLFDLIGMDRILIGYKEVQVVCAGGQVKQGGVLVGRDIAGEICEGEEAGEGGWNDWEFLLSNGEFADFTVGE